MSDQATIDSLYIHIDNLQKQIDQLNETTRQAIELADRATQNWKNEHQKHLDTIESFGAIINKFGEVNEVTR
ncbi:hypothetical protein [Methylotenera sp.]|uniref:hypothetical protein n=1 Tax=Methylotenera sp. TaxID=2051956 RepID=UPI002489A448|nr:hypothetical protein [Methylotenera sp.]MDI1362553.1 hypothetical protein [Methylotenera sp.]